MTSQLSGPKNINYMYKFVQLVLVLFIVTLFSISAKGVITKKTPAKIQADNSNIELRKFDAGALNQYRKQKEFNYTGQATGQPSFWQRLWYWFWSKVSGLFSGVPYSGEILKYFLLGLCVAFLIYMIIKYSGIGPAGILGAEAKKIELPYSEALENIHEINFDSEIEKAVLTHNYRLAVRLLYLKCLKQLSDANLIKWEIDKTNSAYINELQDLNQKRIFAMLTNQFEYAWYGNFAINQQVFGNINRLFDDFKTQLP